MTCISRINPESNTPIDLIAQLDVARARLDRSTALLNRALDLCEMLDWQLDMGAAVAEVDAFQRDVIRYKRGRPQ